MSRSTYSSEKAKKCLYIYVCMYAHVCMYEYRKTHALGEWGGRAGRAPATSAGRVASTVLLMPSCPLLLYPQHLSPPPLAMRHVWASPRAMATAETPGSVCVRCMRCVRAFLRACACACARACASAPFFCSPPCDLAFSLFFTFVQ